MKNRYENGPALDEILKLSDQLTPEEKRQRLDTYVENYYIDTPCEKDGITPLSRATLAGDLDAVKILLETEPDVNMGTNVKGRTALHYAALKGDRAIAKELIDHGADIDAWDNNLHTPLMYSTEEKDLETAKFLVENGANVNMRDKHGNIALFYAMKNVDKEMMTHLIASGSNLDIQNDKGFSASFIKDQIIELHEHKMATKEEELKNSRDMKEKSGNIKPDLTAISKKELSRSAKELEKENIGPSGNQQTKNSHSKFRDMVSKSRSNTDKSKTR